MTSESDLLARIQMQLSKGSTRLLRVNAGISWAGRIVHQTQSSITLSPYGAVKLADTGVSDLIGFSPLGGVAVYTAVEVKAPKGRVRPEQERFIAMVLECGGRAGIARSVEDAARILGMEPRR